MRNEILNDQELSLTGFIRLRQLIAGGYFPGSQATLWRHVKAGTFPAPVKLSLGITAWRIADVKAWQRARMVDANAQ